MKIKGFARRKEEFEYCFEVLVHELVSIPNNAEVTIEWEEPSPVHECSAQPEWVKIIHNGHQWNVWLNTLNIRQRRESLMAVSYCPYCGEKLSGTG